MKQPPTTYECLECGGTMDLIKKKPAPHLGVYMPCIYRCRECGITADVNDDFNVPDFLDEEEEE